MGGICTGTAIKCGMEALKPTGGRIFLFLSDMPSTGINALKQRNDVKFYNTEKERLLLSSESTSGYKAMGEELQRTKVGVDMFVLSHNDIDLASLVPIVASSGGSLQYYPFFNERT